MKLNSAKNILHGNKQVKKVYWGEYLIWPTESPVPPTPPEPPIPSIYELLEAIEAPSMVDGRSSQPLTLNYYYKTITKLVIDFVPLFDDKDQESIYNGYYIFSASYASGLYINYKDGYSRFFIGDATTIIEEVQVEEVPEIGERYILNTGKNYCDFHSDVGNSFNIDTQHSIYNDIPHLSGRELKIFDGVPPAHIRCYSIKIYEDEEIPIVLYPVKRIFDGAIGFYDIVNNLFYSLYGDYIAIPK